MMTVRELMAELQELDQDLPVYIYADHGQANIQCRGTQIEHVESLEYYAETAWDDDGETPDTSKPKVCIIYD